MEGGAIVKLESLDFEILEFVFSRGLIPKSDVINHFKNKNICVEYRLRIMSTPLLNENMPPRISSHPARYRQNVLSSYDDKVEITEYGKKVLEDYNEQKNLQKNKAKENRIWNFISISISLIALFKSFWSELTFLWQQLMLIWKS